MFAKVADNTRISCIKHRRMHRPRSVQAGDTPRALTVLSVLGFIFSQAPSVNPAILAAAETFANAAERTPQNNT